MPTILNQERTFKGWKPSPPDPRDLKFSTPFHASITMPSAVEMMSFVTPIETQTDNDCTANSGSSGIESTYKKAGGQAPNLSRRFLYYATRVWVENQDATADEGAFIRSVCKALSLYGIPLETEWPYSEPVSKSPSSAARSSAKTRQLLSYYSCPSLTSVRYALYKGYYVLGGFMVPGSIGDDETTKTGFVKMPKKGEGWEGGHAVLFCGYNNKLRYNGQTGHLTFANSWGRGWGKKGFGFLPYEYVKLGYALDFWALKLVEK